MALTPAQQQSVNDSGGYYDANGTWVDQSGSSGASQGATAGSGGSTATSLAGLASLTPLIINMLKGSSQPNPGALIGTIPGGQDLVNSIVGQQQQQAPLRQAVTQQAMNMLPNSAYPGGRPALSAVGAGPAPVASSSSGSDLAKLLAAGGAGAGLGALLAKLASGGSSGGDLGKLAAAIKNLFSGGSGGGVQGNKPYPGGALTGGGQDPNSGFTGWPGTDPGSGLLLSDPGTWWDPNTGSGAAPTDPSGGSGVGPGMQDYYATGGGSSSGEDGSEET